MKKAVIGLGTNLGDRGENLRRAVRALDLLPGTRVTRISQIYETEPFDVLSEQENYWNCCVEVETEFSPKVLLGACLGIETGMGRERVEYHGARIIDLDLLLYEKFFCEEPECKVPHPGILERSFVLAPLGELYPEKMALGLDFSTEFYTTGSEKIHALEKKLEKK